MRENNDFLQEISSVLCLNYIIIIILCQRGVRCFFCGMSKWHTLMPVFDDYSILWHKKQTGAFFVI